MRIIKKFKKIYIYCFRYGNFWTGAKAQSRYYKWLSYAWSLASLNSRHQFSRDLMFPWRFSCGLRLNAEMMCRWISLSVFRSTYAMSVNPNSAISLYILQTPILFSKFHCHLASTLRYLGKITAVVFSSHSRWRTRLFSRQKTNGYLCVNIFVRFFELWKPRDEKVWFYMVLFV